MWVWLKDKGSPWLGLMGGFILVLYGIIPTFQKFPSFGRTMRLMELPLSFYPYCGWRVDKQTPDMYDWIGSLICLIGVGIILYDPRS